MIHPIHGKIGAVIKGDYEPEMKGFCALDHEIIAVKIEENNLSPLYDRETAKTLIFLAKIISYLTKGKIVTTDKPIRMHAGSKNTALDIPDVGTVTMMFIGCIRLSDPDQDDVFLLFGGTTQKNEHLLAIIEAFGPNSDEIRRINTEDTTLCSKIIAICLNEIEDPSFNNPAHQKDTPDHRIYEN
jgi:hypothetical protein